jgi:hypothetical protein
MSQSSVTCAWPNLGVTVIFSNERVIENGLPAGFFGITAPLKWCVSGAIIS